MFYAQFVLSKKGPLAKIWLAAHWEKKLSKAQIYETNVQDAVDEILKPKVKMALRTTGHLLLGIVRIYSRKTKYLLADCNEAFLKIKMAFRPGQEDAMLLDDGKEAPANITGLPEVYADFDTALPDFNDAEFANNLQISQSRIDDITLKEDLHADPSKMVFNDFGGDDFGEGAFGGAYDGMDDFGELAAGGALMGDGSFFEGQRDRRDSTIDIGNSRDAREPTPLIDAMKVVPGNAIFGDDDFGGAGDFGDDDAMGEMDHPYPDNMAASMPIDAPGADMADDLVLGAAANNLQGVAADESFVLEPLEAGALERQEKRRKKRRLILDEVVNISGEEMKRSMADYSDTLQTLDLAPPSRRLMKLKEAGTVEKLFHMPGCSLMKAKPLIRMYQSHLVLKARVDESSQTADQIHQDLELDELVDDDMGHIPESNYGQDDYGDDFADIPEPFQRDATPPPMELEQPAYDDSPAKENDEFHGNERKKRKMNESSRTEDDEAADGDDDHRWTKRTQGVLNSIATKLRTNGDEIMLNDLLTKGATRKTAAQKFYTMLVLKKWQAIDVRQDEPYGDIFITAGPNIAQTINQ